MFKRKDRSSILLGISEHAVHAARMQAEPGIISLDRLAELPPDDEEAVAQWLRTAFPEKRAGLLPGYVSFHPAERLLLRDAVNPRRLLEPHFLHTLVAEQTRIPSAREWQVALLNPVDGLPIGPDSPQRAGLVAGVPWTAVRDTQQRLRRWGIRPRRLELGTLNAIGAVTRHIAVSNFPDGVAYCEIGRSQTRLYLIGKDGVHTPPALPHGLLSIEEAAMRELAAPDVATALRALEAPTESLHAHSRRLVRMISRHLRPAIDYFEMQTGQRIGALFCGHLRTKLAWLETALARGVDLDPFPVELGRWLPAAGLRIEGEFDPASATWLPTLGAVAQLNPDPADPAAAPAPATAA